MGIYRSRREPDPAPAPPPTRCVACGRTDVDLRHQVAEGHLLDLCTNPRRLPPAPAARHLPIHRKDSSVTAVKIKGTFKKDSRPNNGLEAISDEIVKDEFGSWVVVGIIKQHHVDKAPGEEATPTADIVAIEPVFNEAAEQVRAILNKARGERNQDNVPETLFDAAGAKFTAAGADAPASEADSGPVSERKPDEWLDPDGPKPAAKKRGS